jgi:lysophospholipase L1-like esterase
VTHVKALLPDVVMTWARRSLIGWRTRKLPDARFPEVPADRLAQFETDLRTTVGVARSLGVPVVLMGHANATMAPGFDDPALIQAWVYQFPHASGKTLMEFHARAYAIEEQVAGDSSLTWVPLREALAGQWDDAFADFVHFTDAGAGVVAAALAEPIAPLIGCATGQAP